MAYYGNGGFNYESVYAMPVWLRNINYKFLNEAKQKEKEEMDKANSKTNTKPSSPTIHKPHINIPKK